MFDPNAFLDNPVNAAGSTEFPNCPPGEFPAECVGVEVRTLPPSADGSPNSPVMEVSWRVLEGYNGPPVRQSIFLDLTPDGSQLDMSEGKNVNFNRLRAVFNGNIPGWQARQLVGQRARIRVEIDRKDDRYRRVTQVASLYGQPQQAAQAPAQAPQAPQQQPQTAPAGGQPQWGGNAPQQGPQAPQGPQGGNSGYAPPQGAPQAGWGQPQTAQPAQGPQGGPQTGNTPGQGW